MNQLSKTFFEREVDRIMKENHLPQYYYVQVRQSKAFMENHFSEKIDLSAIAKSACMSRFHFIRVFQQIYGLTPRQFLRDVRIAKAKALLKNGHSVSEVCFAVGYESLPTFSKVFKSGTGRSPKVYRDSQY